MNDFLPAHHAVTRWAEKMPDREFLLQPVDGELRVYTWREADDTSRRVATALSTLGLSRGDKVAILAKNSAEWLLADLAIAMAGMISVPIYPTAGVETVRYILEHKKVFRLKEDLGTEPSFWYFSDEGRARS